MRQLVLQLAESNAEIDECFPVMCQLRSHVAANAFVRRVRRQMLEGYRLLFGRDEQRVAAVAGFRLIEMLSSGRMLYIDDLVIDASARSRGYGRQLMSWLVAHAREHGCREVHLDSAVHRFEAHRFYLAQRMKISDHHFVLELQEQ